MKTKSHIKGAIFTNIAMLGVTIVMLISMSYAWFMMSDTSLVEQVITIGKFSVTLDDETDTYEGFENINIGDGTAGNVAFPMTFEYATAQSILPTTTGGTAGPLKNVFRFEIENNGSIGAMVRFGTKITLDSNFNYIDALEGTAAENNKVEALATQVRYAVRASRALPAANSAGFTVPDYGALQNSAETPVAYTSAFLFDSGEGDTESDTDTNLSLADYLNNIVAQIAGNDTAGYTSGLIVEGAGDASNKDVYYIDIMVWVDANATSEKLGSNLPEATLASQLKFIIGINAIQSEGGATWTADEIKDTSSWLTVPTP